MNAALLPGPLQQESRHAAKSSPSRDAVEFLHLRGVLSHKRSQRSLR